jgi:hypothetical protein
MKSLKLLFASAAAAALLAAANPSGRWMAEFQGPQGNTVHSVMSFKVEGETLTGTVEGPRGGQTPITDGKIQGDELTFAVIRHWQGVDFRTIYHGTIKRDVIHFTVTREGGDGLTREFDAKRGS